MKTNDICIALSLLFLLASIIATGLLHAHPPAIALLPAVCLLVWGLLMAPVPLPKVTRLLAGAAGVEALFIVLVKVLA